MPDLKAMYRGLAEDHFPDTLSLSIGGQDLSYRKKTWTVDHDGRPEARGLRYGDNPGQEAALYELASGRLELGGCRFAPPREGLVSALAGADLLQPGKHPGKTNLTDLDSALHILRHLDGRPACCIMKHNNPCGVAYGQTAAEAYARAHAADRLAAFGGCAALSAECSAEAACAMAENYLEMVAAPEFAPGAVDLLKTRKSLRIVRLRRLDRIRDWAPARYLDIKCLLDGGLLLQQSPANRIRQAADFLPAEAWRKDGSAVRMGRAPTARELEDLLFAWQVEQGVTSNSVLLARDGATVSIGAGGQDRVGVAEWALLKARRNQADGLALERHGCLGHELKLRERRGQVPAGTFRALEEESRSLPGGPEGAVAASDAFFPKRDGVDVLAAEGVSAIVQPGGSIADAEILDAANEAGMAMVFTGQRAFRH